ncbi:hypothetical protein [Helicobacter sp. 16-1353]|uniref:hypothetical protein n=1 Tax=Helicobacter sp. 16-1353 TaxID=2004996 RepID=UPI0015EFCC83|nr:hypothetical protein [Helicobacter sp. 16-1353]
MISKLSALFVICSRTFLATLGSLFIISPKNPANRGCVYAISHAIFWIFLALAELLWNGENASFRLKFVCIFVVTNLSILSWTSCINCSPKALSPLAITSATTFGTTPAFPSRMYWIASFMPFFTPRPTLKAVNTAISDIPLSAISSPINASSSSVFPSLFRIILFT